MDKLKKSKLTIFLLTMIVLLMLSAFYISYILTRSDEAAVVTPLKIKASRKTYSKLIALNPPEVAPSPTIETNPQPTLQDITPTPTEIIVAVNNTPTFVATESSALAPDVDTVTPTGVTSLPESGFVKNTIFFVSVAGLIIFLSFIF